MYRHLILVLCMYIYTVLQYSEPYSTGRRPNLQSCCPANTDRGLATENPAGYANTRGFLTTLDAPPL